MLPILHIVSDNKGFNFTLKTCHGTMHHLVSRTCVEHDIEHLIFNLGYTESEELQIQQLGNACSLKHINNPIERVGGGLLGRVEWEHPELDLSSWYSFLKWDQSKPFDVFVVFLHNKALLY